MDPGSWTGLLGPPYKNSRRQFTGLTSAVAARLPRPIINLHVCLRPQINMHLLLMSAPERFRCAYAQRSVEFMKLVVVLSHEMCKRLPNYDGV